MKSNSNKRQKISRKKFLQICSSFIAGGSIAGISGVLLSKHFAVPYTSLNSTVRGKITGQWKNGFNAPYKLISSFTVPDQIEAFELAGENIIVAASNNIFVYDRTGGLINNFAIASNLRDIAVDNENIYLLFPARIEVYNRKGEWLREWNACSDSSDYCSMAIAPGLLFATDAANKNICQYTVEGEFVRFIQSPEGFVIPSYSFGITYTGGVVYCSNSGRHKVEKYTPDGKYLGSFGKAGGVAGMFCGCCNPVHLAYTSTGEIITSEKGNPRISCYSPDGEFRSLLLDRKILGGGNTAYDIKVRNDKIFVAGKNIISTYQYDSRPAAATACSDCSVDCPLRKGITV
ncbi:MAG: hypothetical protein LBH90_07870 [Tannerella sp.]|jgi:hypothetical protein|nr:hypothetical protein [Tannerella sp.]